MDQLPLVFQGQQHDIGFAVSTKNDVLADNVLAQARQTSLCR